MAAMKGRRIVGTRLLVMRGRRPIVDAFLKARSGGISFAPYACVRNEFPLSEPIRSGSPDELIEASQSKPSRPSAVCGGDARARGKGRRVKVPRSAPRAKTRILTESLS